jgi:4-amino-4-deoxy-L-arabinose transferase-like glycosyltransferase
MPCGGGQPVASRTSVTVSTPSFGWISRRPQTALALLTLICLLPFSGKAFHADDPLFIRAAQQIVKHPLDPYGFRMVWFEYEQPMSRVTQNPPLASYYMAAVGSVAGWRERTLHLTFILPAVGAVLGTYRLARRFTRKPLLAAAATLLAPGFLVSATGVMCDVMMLALWLWAAIFWIQGLDEPGKSWSLAISSLLIAACALTKYFAVSLIPLLLVYTLVRKRRLGSWIFFLLLPILVLGAYELWSRAVYGHGLIAYGIYYIQGRHMMDRDRIARLSAGLVGLAFAGGCTLPALTFVPLLWNRIQFFAGGLLSALLTFSFFSGWINPGSIYLDHNFVLNQWGWVNIQLFFYLAGGISLLALAIADFAKRKDTASVLLLLWVAGTLYFSVVVNWTVNARSLLPLVPAVAILIARRLDRAQRPFASWAIAVPLVLSGAVSVWVAYADASLANSARMAANYVHQQARDESGAVEFQGHWGLQYYMEEFGARPLEQGEAGSHPGDIIVIPVNNTNRFRLAEETTLIKTVEIPLPLRVTTISPEVGAGFYSSVWGPLPFAIGPVPNERYYMVRVIPR